MARTTITISTETSNDINELCALLETTYGTDFSKHKSLRYAVSYTKKALKAKINQSK
jgi:hypothetical protein